MNHNYSYKRKTGRASFYFILIQIVLYTLLEEQINSFIGEVEKASECSDLLFNVKSK